MTTSFESIYRTHHAQVLKHARRLVHEADAEDLAQRVWLKVLRGLPEFRGQSQISTWLYVITRHLAATTYRQRTTRTWGYAAPLKAAVHLPATDPSPDVRAMQRDAWQQLLAGLKALPQHERAVIKGRLSGELGRETARRLGIPESTVKTRFHRARRRLLAGTGRAS